MVIVAAVRSTRIDRLIPNDDSLLPFEEATVPNLADKDIEAILEVLEREKRLGVLLGMSRSERVKVFKDLAGRQLIVAMIEATSGEKFEERLHSELSELAADARLAYALVATATHARFALHREDIMVAMGLSNNEVLNTLNSLVARGVLTENPTTRSLRARHRVVAEVLHNELEKEGLLAEVYAKLAFLSATKIGPNMQEKSKWWRFNRYIMSHDRCLRLMTLNEAHMIFNDLEEALGWSHHFWLQRGALELEVGDLRLAQNWLEQARALAPNDGFVLTEYAYFRFRLANEQPANTRASEYVDEAVAMLEHQIEMRGKLNPYPYHILGKEGLVWASIAGLAKDEKREFLRRIKGSLDEGRKLHPRNDKIAEIYKGVELALWHTFVPGAGRSQGQVPSDTGGQQAAPQE